jgi:hypothetical protein
MITGSTPSNDYTLCTFVPQETFQHEQNLYVEGMVYNLREGNDRLLDLVTTWELMNLVVCEPTLLTKVMEKH